MNEVGKSLKDYPTMPFPDASYLHGALNRLIEEEKGYDKIEMKIQHDKSFTILNPDQLEVYNTIVHSINIGRGGMFFVYGSGGCGKTFL